MSIEVTAQFQLLLLEQQRQQPHSPPPRRNEDGTRPFERTARRTLAKLVELHGVVAENLGPYVDFLHGLSDEQRNVLDRVCNEAVREVEARIRELKQQQQADGDDSGLGGDARAHRAQVVALLDESLRAANATLGNARSIRHSHVLATGGKLQPVVTESHDQGQDSSDQRRVVDNDAVSEYLSSLGEDERQTLELESRALEEQLTNEVEAARRIERSAHDLAHLMTLMAEKVLDQDHVIDSLHTQAKENVEIVNQVPEVLISAAEHGKRFRHFMLIFLLVSGISLLLFHWGD